MKALLVTREYPPHIYGGAGVVVDQLSRALARPGSGEAPDDPLGPVPGDPDWAGGEIHVEGGTAVRTPRSPAASLLLGLPRMDWDLER